MLISYIFPAPLVLLLVSAQAADYRLLKTVVPSHYNLDIVVDPEDSKYSGFVEITATATNVTDGIIKINSAPKDIDVSAVLFNYDSSCNFTQADEETEILTLSCPKEKVDGEFVLTIHFEGTFASDMDGFYKSTYEEDGKKQVLVATQFESSSARRAFPCFDEPSFKAKFDIYITHPVDYNVLGNTPVKSSFDVGTGIIQTQFETTPIMSTYLVAFIVSKFVPSTSDVSEKYAFAVYARPSAKNFTNVAVTYGPQLIDALSAWTSIDYTELGNTQAYEVAIPDFSAGAMENWGLITFREVTLLDEGDKTALAAKRRIIRVIAHELSHQWFGDYVTLDWWSDLWLNEGFATYFEFHIPDLLKDGSEFGNEFVTDVHQVVLVQDAVPSSLPMSSPESEIDSPTKYSSKFDDISYDKAGSVIRMLRYIVGEDVFQNGLNMYLTKNKYSNSNPTLLLSALQQALNDSSIDIAKIMDNWIYKSGFPLVTVTLNQNGGVNLTQERYTTGDSSVNKTQWYVPITYTTAAENNFDYVIKNWLEPENGLTLEVGDSWVIFNLQETGFYRVNYDDELWDRIITALKNDTVRKQIHVLNRAQLVDDIFNIAKVGKVDYKKAFELAEFLTTETDYYPWVSALNAISYIYGKLGDDEAELLLQDTILRWITTAFPKGYKTGDKDVDVLKNTFLSDWACKVGEENCINYAKSVFEDYKKNDSLPDYNLRGVVFCYALRESDDPDADYEFLFNVFKNSTSSIEQNAIITALGCISNTTVLSKYISETISDDSPIRKQDASSVFKAIYLNSDVGVDVSLTFLEKNVVKLVDTFKGLGVMKTLFTGLAGKLSTDDEIERMNKIIEANKDNESIGTVKDQAEDIIAANKAWRDSHASMIKDILKKSPSGANTLQPKYVFTVLLSLSALFLLDF